MKSVLGDDDARAIVEAAYEKYGEDKAPETVAFMAGAMFGFKLQASKEIRCVCGMAAGIPHNCPGAGNTLANVAGSNLRCGCGTYKSTPHVCGYHEPRAL